MSVKDYILCFIKSFLQTSMIVILSLGILYVIRINLKFANYISNITGIPSDMSCFICISFSKDYENIILWKN